MKPGREWFGLGLSGAAGMTLGYAWTEIDRELWWVGALTLLSASLFALSAVYLVNNRRRDQLRAMRESRRSPTPAAPLPPPLRRLAHGPTAWRSRSGEY